MVFYHPVEMPKLTEEQKEILKEAWEEYLFHKKYSFMKFVKYIKGGNK